MSWPLKYVCKWCGVTISVDGSVRSEQPAVLSVCDRRDCREAASSAYRGRP